MAIRTLVVDDEADILRLIEIKLKKAGFEVTTARDGQEGLDKALAIKPDLLLIDVMMPKLDGYSVVAEVRNVLGAESPIIILLTARGQETDVIKGLTSGADDYIIKPFSPRELIARINVALIKSGKHTTPPSASEL
ncbi:MAG TPA: response regulator [Ktedonobacteraceae bacterium]|nr:response regulator [Ktedonobacteraceae bacterium]